MHEIGLALGIWTLTIFWGKTVVKCGKAMHMSFLRRGTECIRKEAYWDRLGKHDQVFPFKLFWNVYLALAVLWTCAQSPWAPVTIVRYVVTFSLLSGCICHIAWLDVMFRLLKYCRQTNLPWTPCWWKTPNDVPLPQTHSSTDDILAP